MNLKLDVPYYKQNRDYTCGPACLRMVMEFFGVKLDEVSLTMLCGTTIAGTSLSEMSEAARRLGFEIEWKTSGAIRDLMNGLQRGIPVIVMIDARLLHSTTLPTPFGHMIVVLAIQGNRIFYHDSEIGPEQTISRRLFVSSWEILRKGMVMLWR